MVGSLVPRRVIVGFSVVELVLVRISAVMETSVTSSSVSLFKHT